MSQSPNRVDHHRSRVQRYYQRFPANKVEGSGVDPMGSFREFVGKDVRRNIDVHRDEMRKSADMRLNETTQLGEFAVPGRGWFHQRRASEIPAEVTSPAAVRERTGRVWGGSLTNKGSGEGWSPPDYASALSSSMSVNYDPISFLPRPYASLRKNTSIDARRRKGITEIADKQHLFYSNLNPAHSQALAAHPQAFHYRKGVFMQMWEVSARQGFFNRPFAFPHRKKSSV